MIRKGTEPFRIFLSPLGHISLAESLIYLKRFAELLCRPFTFSTQVCKFLELVTRPKINLLQSVGHSLTIVGLEERKNGAFNLLVLDPMFKPSPAILNLIDVRFTPVAPEKLLKAYRRGETYLSKYTNFEILK